jgi:hypothetical protein
MCHVLSQKNQAFTYWGHNYPIYNNIKQLRLASK